MTLGRPPRTPLLRALVRAIRAARAGERDERGVRRDRREFLVKAASVAVALPLGAALLERPALARATPPPPPKPRRGADPVAIVGAGVAGLTAAFRLMQAGVACQVFEGSARLGGRILTDAGSFADGQFCELGGEFVDRGHADLIALADELELKRDDLKSGDAGVELYHFGGKLFSEKELIPAFGGIGKAIAAEQAQLYVKDASGGKDWSDHARALDKVSLRAWLDAHADGVEKWILDLLDVAYTIEYGRACAEQSALNLLAYIDPDTSGGFKLFGESDEGQRLAGGNSALIEALRKKLEGKVEIHLGHQLVRIEDAKPQLALTFQQSMLPKTRSFPRVVVALPFTTLREVEGIGKLGLSPEKVESIRTLGYGTSVKVMFGFTSRPWRAKRDGRPECNGSLYTSTSSQCFWETSRKQDGRSGILTNFLGGTPSARAVDDAFRRETLANLDAMLPGLTAAHDGRTRTFDWRKYAYTKGAYSCPLVGQLTTLAPAAATNELDGRLLFAGEHTSDDFSGFMNGAVESGNRVAREIAAKK